MKKLWTGFSPTVRLAVFILALILLISIFAPLLAPYAPNKTAISERLQPYSREHLLGTDHLGRDYFSRVLYGGRESILLALAATALSMLVGILIGILAGYVGGAFDSIVMILTSMFQGIPSTCFTIAIIGILGTGMKSILFALVITSWTGCSRIVRMEILRVKNRPFADMARSYGIGHVRMLTRHILPNIADNLIVLFTTKMSQTILSVASLSFLGLGVQPPTPDWGVMISDARGYFYQDIGLLLWPCLCIFLVSWSVNTIGEGLRLSLENRRDNIGEL